jgi:hypothetical protein
MPYNLIIVWCAYFINTKLYLHPSMMHLYSLFAFAIISKQYIKTRQILIENILKKS